MKLSRLRLVAGIVMLGLAVGFGAAWPVSYSRALGVAVGPLGIAVYRGSLAIVFRHGQLGPEYFDWIDESAEVEPSIHMLINFLWIENPYEIGFGVPLWMYSPFFGYLGILILRYSRTIPPWICLHCGYDLRATPDRCPECGVVPAGKEIAASSAPIEGSRNSA